MKLKVFLLIIFVFIFLTTLRTAVIAITPTPSTLIPSFCYTRQFGDANCDGIINNADFDIWKQETSGQITSLYSNFFADDRIDLIDFEIWRRYSNGLAIPSPTFTSIPTADPSPTAIPNLTIDSSVIITSSPTITSTITLSLSPTSIPTPLPTGPNCCSNEQLVSGYQCVQDCQPQVTQLNETLPTYSCLSPSQSGIRQSSGCSLYLSDDTMIQTPDGVKNIKDLKTSGWIWSLDKFGNKIAVRIRVVISFYVHKGHKVHKLKLQDGRTLLISPGHPTGDGKNVSFYKAGDHYDDSVIQSNDLIPYDKDKTYDILPDSETGTYWANGILIRSKLFKPKDD